MPTVLKIDEIVRHYVDDHWSPRNLDELAEELRKNDQLGSKTSISAWKNGLRPPQRRSQVETLLDIVGCPHMDYDREAIKKIWPDGAKAPVHQAPMQPTGSDGADGEVTSAADRASASTRRRSVRLPVALASVVAVVAASILWYVNSSDHEVYRIVVQSNTDELITEPRLLDAAGNFVTALPIDQVPKPPDGRDTCVGRFAWAHGPDVRAIDAEATVFKISITAKDSTILVNAAGVVFDGYGDQLAQTLLACPGRGGPTPTHLLSLDLDNRRPAQFFLDGDENPDDLGLSIPPGQTESILVVGGALEHYCKWRLELGLDDGERALAVTIGPDGALPGRAADHPGQRSFETTGDFAAAPFRFRDEHWQPGR